MSVASLEASGRIRAVTLSSPVGEQLILKKMVGTERLGEPFRFDLELLSEDPDVSHEALLGQSVTAHLELPNQEVRHFNGFVSDFLQTGHHGNCISYRATLRPWIWFLSRTADCRIFQKRAVPDIIKETFAKHGFTDLEDALTGTYVEREYCVQYRETDLDFVSRLLEEEGIYYYFKHESNRHVLVLADAACAHEPIPGYEQVPYMARDQNMECKPEHVYEWSIAKSVQPGRYSMDGFDFTRPRADLHVRCESPRDHAGNLFEVYDYSGGYTKFEDGQAYARVRLEELHAQFEQVQGKSDARGLFAGGLFSLTDYPREDQNREYLILAVRYEVAAEDCELGDEPDADLVYQCSFSAAEGKQPYRSPSKTPKPIVQGPQTAIVVGPSEQEIFTDKFGRVKVQFHWDRLGKYDEKSSCWIRVAQLWAGKGWGGIHIPRINQEVIVEFLEGDPDRPLITGRVYNGDNMPPYGLPKDKTQSGIKSRSSKGGAPDNFNELRFEDKKGSEQVYLHAEKDLTVDVKNSESHTVGAGCSITAGGSISESSGANISRTADDNIVDKAGANITTESGKNMALQAGGSYALKTSLGIHMKAINFVAAMIESGAKAAAAAIKKGAVETAAASAAAAGQASANGGGAGGAALGQAQSSAASTGAKALAALSPAIEAGAAELGRLSDQAADRAGKLDGPVSKAIEKADALGKAIENGASPEAIAAAFMEMADAVSEAFKDAQELINGLLPQIPSIVLWAMKDINAYALWSLSLKTKVRDISIEAKNRHVHVKAKQNVNIQSAKKDINIKASKKKVLITGKEEVNIKAEDKNLVIEAGKQKVTVKAAKQIFLKCGKASISLAESGNIVISGEKINVNGKSQVKVKGKPIKLN